MSAVAVSAGFDHVWAFDKGRGLERAVCKGPSFQLPMTLDMDDEGIWRSRVGALVLSGDAAVVSICGTAGIGCGGACWLSSGDSGLTAELCVIWLTTVSLLTALVSPELGATLGRAAVLGEPGGETS